MRIIISIVLMFLSVACFSQRDIHGKWRITRLYLGDSTRALPGSKVLRYNPTTGEVSFADTTVTSGGSSLTATYIGYGNGSNVLTGTSDFIRNSSGEVILNASDKGAYKFQVEGNMYLGNSTGAVTATPEQFNMGGKVADDYTDPAKVKLILFNTSTSYSGIGVANDGGSARVVSYFVDGTGAARHAFFCGGTERLNVTNLGLFFPFTGAAINFNNNVSITHSSGVLAVSGDVTVGDEAYDATAWNGSLEVPTKNAIRDKIETLTGAGEAHSYTPTLTNQTNISASSLFQATYLRIDSIVEVQITGQLTPTLGALTNSELRFSLPITTSSATNQAWVVTGNFIGAGVLGNQVIGVGGLVSTTVGQFFFQSNSTSASSVFQIKFQYKL